MRNANLGLYLDRSSSAIPDRGLSDCKNVRIKNGFIRNELMGWEAFSAIGAAGTWTGFGVTLIDLFTDRQGSTNLIFGSKYDLLRWDTGSSDVLFLNEIYDTGNATVTNGSPTVEFAGGTDLVTAGIKPNDWIHFNDAGYRQLNPVPAISWWRVDSVTDLDTLELGGNWALGTLTNVAFTIRRTFTGTESDYWSTAVFPDAPTSTDYWYATNGTEIVRWDGSSAAIEDQTSYFYFSCKALAYHKNRMLFANIVDSGTGESRPGSVVSSAIGDPQNVSTLEASEFVVPDQIDTILALKPLGDYVVAYCEKSINIMQSVEPPLNFINRTAAPTIGLIAGRMVVDYGDYHEFLSNDRGYRFDGVSVAEFGGQIFREALRQFDPSRKTHGHTLLDAENGEAHWIIPKPTDTKTTGADTAYTEHYLEQVGRKESTPFTFRDLPATAAGRYQDTGQKRWSDFSTTNFDEVDFAFNDRFFTTNFPFILFGDTEGRIWKLGTLSTKNGAAIESRARFPRRPMWDGRQKGLLMRIEPFAERKAGSTYDLTVNLYTADHAEGEAAIEYAGAYDLDHASRRVLSVRKAGLFGELEFVTTGSGNTWAISGFAVESSPMGER